MRRDYTREPFLSTQKLMVPFSDSQRRFSESLTPQRKICKMEEKRFDANKRQELGIISPCYIREKVYSEETASHERRSSCIFT